VLLIGGAGYIGRNLLPCLRGRVNGITVLGRRQVDSANAAADVAYVSGDFADAKILLPLLDKHDIIVHLAYATVPNTSFNDPLADLLQNLPSSVRLFTEIAARGKRLVLLSSGGTIYGEALSLPIAEDQPARPISPYGVTKLTLEHYAQLYAVTHGLQFTCIRPSNPYGPGQRPFAGQGFIATAMASAMRGQPVKVFGERGTIRDYVYISDLAAGIADLLTLGKPSHAYNIGSGEGRSNMDAIDAMWPLMREFGHALQVEHLPERPFDVKANVLDTKKIGELTGWKPEVTFEQGLRLTYDSSTRRSTPLVTVAMPIYNAGKYLRMAVRSIQLQTFENWELLIIDDGSTDNAVADIADLVDPRIRILRDGHNRGLAARLNEAIDQARSVFFARMDQDDVAYPERLARQVALLEQESTLDLTATRAILIDENDAAIGVFPYAGRHHSIVAWPWRGFHFPHPTWMGRLAWFRKHRYARPAPYFCEDQELLLRTYPNSHFGIVDDVLFAYRVRYRFNPVKQFKTRKALWQIQCSQFRARKQWRYLMLSTAVMAARVSADGLRQLTWHLGTGRRAVPLPSELATRWQAVRALVNTAPSDAK
jgi:UDP-glucose 4-epimerase